MRSTPDRDLLVLFKTQFMSQQAIEEEVDSIKRIISRIERPNELCKVYELVNRNQITQKHHKLLAAIRQMELKPFWFLINKN